MKRTGPLLFFGLIICTSIVLADNTIPSAEKQQLFIRELTKNADYYRAITETFRLYYYYPAQKLPLEFNLASLYMSGGNSSLARNNWFICLTNRSLPPSDRLEIRQGLARSYEMEGDWQNALNQYMQSPANSSNKQELNLKMVEMDIRLFKTADAGLMINNMDPRTLAPGAALRLSFLKTKLAEARHLPYKSEVVADIFSVIPGMNMFYLGHFKDGLIRLTVQAGTGYLIWTAFNQKRPDYVTGIFLSATLLTWYIYNFSMNSEAVDEFNRAMEKKFEGSF